MHRKQRMRPAIAWLCSVAASTLTMSCSGHGARDGRSSGAPATPTDEASMGAGTSGIGGGMPNASGAGMSGVVVGNASDGGMQEPPSSAGQAAPPSSDAASLAGAAARSCQVYCMTDADCCAQLGLGEGCPNRYPDRALCQIDPDLGWDHVCRTLGGACQDDAECQAEDPDLVCAENAPHWCSASYCPGLNTCLARGCMQDDECEAGFICIVQGRIGHYERGCAGPADCLGIGGQCMEGLYPEDPRGVCVQPPNHAPPLSPPKAADCETDSDCAASAKGPRCNAGLGLCGCGDDGDCAGNERCRCELGQACPAE